MTTTQSTSAQSLLDALARALVTLEGLKHAQYATSHVQTAVRRIIDASIVEIESAIEANAEPGQLGGLTDDEARAIFKRCAMPYVDAQYEPAIWIINAIKESARAALAQAAPVQQAGHSNCSECPSGTLTRDDVDVMSLNSARFRWLTEDHADPITRAKVAEILGRMSVMSHSATCADIDIAIGEADDRAAAPKPGADHV